MAVSNGIALGLGSIAVLALVSRFFHDAFATPAVNVALGTDRLSYPVNYWNGLAILVGLAVPLLLRAGIEARTEVQRVIAVALIPAIACTIDFASSRSGILAATSALLGFLAIAPRRWAVGGLSLVAG
ncbi:MAG TPA: hypothetical protein VM690_00685, partial [Gaiellaceae bacterium]|nr:hypothetical protein [Gaiellaceae bacterium]